MEEKKITEQESLQLISQMIQQTKRDSAIGSGDGFLIWGYLCTITSLAVVGLACCGGGYWGWVYMAIPLIGFTVAGIYTGRRKKRPSRPVTYSTQSINGIWGCLSGVFSAYLVWCLFNYDAPAGWAGMFMLALLLPGIGTCSTGIILKERVLQVCGLAGEMIGVFFLHHLCCNGMPSTIVWPLVMAGSMVITLIIPGHYLNYKTKNNKG